MPLVSKKASNPDTLEDNSEEEEKGMEEPAAMNNENENDNDHDNDQTDGILPKEPEYSCWHVVSTVIFVIASSFYLALAVTVLPEERFYQDVPVDVLYSTDDAVWFNYYNETDAFDDVVLNATDDYTWSEWYNASFYPEDDVVFQTNASKETTAVNQYMILYFIAAFGFLCTGLIETCLADTCKGRMLFFTFFVAAGFGVMSSMLVIADPYVSAVLNAVSVHLFAVEAVAAVVRTYRMGRLEGHIQWILMVGNLSLVVGTLMDVVLSYFYVLELAQLPHARTAIAAACFWLLCSLIYLWNSLRERKHFKNSIGSDGDDDDEKKLDDDEVQSVEMEN